jgi:hypothetical protein
VGVTRAVVGRGEGLPLLEREGEGEAEAQRLALRE